MSHSDTLEPTLAAATALASLGRITSALTLFDRLLAERPDDAECWLQKGLLHIDMSDFVAARAALERARDIAPDDARVYFHLARIAASVGRTLAAITLLRAARAIEPDNGEIAINLAQALVVMRRWKAAWEITEPMGDELAGWWASVRSAAREGQARTETQAAALIGIRRARGAPLERNDALTLASLFVSLEHFAGALEIARRLIGEDAGDLDAVLMQATALACQEGPDAALATLDAASARLAGDPRYEMAVARLCFEADDIVRACAHAAAGKAVDRNGYGMMLLADLRWDELFALCRTWIGETDNTAPFALLLRALAGLGRLRMLPDVPPARALAHPIPSVIVQFWDSSAVPEDVGQAIATWRDHNSDFEHRLFDAPGARGFIGEAHGEAAVRAFDRCHHPAMKADFFRVAYLLKEGGIYIDADDACVRPIRTLVQAIGDARFAASVSGDAAPYVHNWFLAAAPGTAILRSAMAEMIAIIEHLHIAGGRADIWHTSGPGLITRAVARALAEAPEAGGDAIFLTTQQYRGYSATQEDLAYKKTPVGNWRRSDETPSPKDRAPTPPDAQEPGDDAVAASDDAGVRPILPQQDEGGVAPDWTADYRGFLEKFIRLNAVRSIVDLGCGDWQVTRFIDLHGADYHGFDPSPALVERNRQRHGGEGIRFDVLPDDLAGLPGADLLVLCDVLPHLPDAEIQHLRDELFGRYRYVLLTNAFDPAATPHAMTGAYVAEFWSQPWERVRSFLIVNPATAG